MIRIHEGDSLYLDSNGEESRLVRRYKLEKKAGYGQTVLGYYPSLKYLIHAAAERKLMELVHSCTSFEEVLQSLSEWVSQLQSPLLADLKEAVKYYERKLEETC